ncbi:MAG: hypothetical protein JSU98_07690 [Gemmatimonadales bacterium]|nr:MAG: hypothetical protein JSU98_07690 [Gemmatimonadales bacterium]
MIARATLVLVALSACAGEPAEEDLLQLPRLRTTAAAAAAAAPASGSSEGLTPEQLASGSYEIPGVQERIVLRGGRWEAPGNRSFAQLSQGVEARGDFDGDGSLETAAILTVGTGGTDLRVYLLAVGSGGEGIRQEAVVLLGAGVQVRDVRSERDAVEVRFLTFGAGDDPCCPTREVTRRYRIRNGTWTPS